MRNVRSWKANLFRWLFHLQVETRAKQRMERREPPSTPVRVIRMHEVLASGTALDLQKGRARIGEGARGGGSRERCGTQDHDARIPYESIACHCTRHD